MPLKAEVPRYFNASAHVCGYHVVLKCDKIVSY